MSFVPPYWSPNLKILKNKTKKKEVRKMIPIVCFFAGTAFAFLVLEVMDRPVVVEKTVRLYLKTKDQQQKEWRKK